MNRNSQPKLCPDCPLRSYIHMVQTESYTTTKAEQTNINICSKLRRLCPGRCPYYPETERIDLYVKAQR